MRHECAAITPLQSVSGIENRHLPRPMTASGIEISPRPLMGSGIEISPRPLMSSGIEIISATPVNTGQTPLEGSTSPVKKSSLKHKGNAASSNLRSPKSLNLQAACDANCRFVNASLCCPGSANDIMAYNASYMPNRYAAYPVCALFPFIYILLV